MQPLWTAGQYDAKGRGNPETVSHVQWVRLWKMCQHSLQPISWVEGEIALPTKVFACPRVSIRAMKVDTCLVVTRYKQFLLVDKCLSKSYRDRYVVGGTKVVLVFLLEFVRIIQAGTSQVVNHASQCNFCVPTSVFQQDTHGSIHWLRQRVHACRLFF